MTASAIKKKITKAVNKIEDSEFLNALHTIINTKMEDEMINDLSPAQKKELDTRKKRHKAGISKSYSWDEIKNELLQRK